MECEICGSHQFEKIGEGEYEGMRTEIYQCMNCGHKVIKVLA